MLVVELFGLRVVEVQPGLCLAQRVEHLRASEVFVPVAKALAVGELDVSAVDLHADGGGEGRVVPRPDHNVGWHSQLVAWLHGNQLMTADRDAHVFFSVCILRAPLRPPLFSL